jgi:hypothetical protein
MEKIIFFKNVFFDEDVEKKKKELYEKKNYKKTESFFFQINFINKFLSHLSNIMGKDFKCYNFYIYRSNNIYESPNSIKINHSKKILIYISNETDYIPSNIEKHFLCIFKCYLPYQLKKSNIFSFPLNIIPDISIEKIIPIEKRKIDIFFIGNLNRNRLDFFRAFYSASKIFLKFPYKFIYSFLTRTSFIKRLIDKDLSNKINGNNFIKFTNGFNAGIQYDKYLKLLNNSKVVLCPKGFMSSETFRHFEAIRAGSVVITEKLPNTYFYKKFPCISINNWAVGLKKAEKLILDVNRLKKLQKKNRVFYDKNLSEAGTAKYVFNILKVLERKKIKHLV